MSKTWYPVIDLGKCAGCMKCVEFCCKGVYKAGSDNPEVENPIQCVHGCSGCHKICPAGAISHVGDSSKNEGCNTSSNNGCGCDCGSGCC